MMSITLLLVFTPIFIQSLFTRTQVPLKLFSAHLAIAGTIVLSYYGTLTMLKTLDLQKQSLSSLYDLMAFKIDELRAVGNPMPDHEEFSELRGDILLIQSIINTKKIEKHPGL